MTALAKGIRVVAVAKVSGGLEDGLCRRLRGGQQLVPDLDRQQPDRQLTLRRQLRVRGVEPAAEAGTDERTAKQPATG